MYIYVYICMCVCMYICIYRARAYCCLPQVASLCSHLETRNLKPETRKPKPGTRDPKPETRAQPAARCRCLSPNPLNPKYQNL